MRTYVRSWRRTLLSSQLCSFLKTALSSSRSTFSGEFEDKALEAIEQKALDRETGARGLRAIMESFLTKLMYEIPGDHTVEKVIITEDTVNNNEATILYNKNKKPVNITINAGNDDSEDIESSVS